MAVWPARGGDLLAKQQKSQILKKVLPRPLREALEPNVE